jgi:hypothetical protein
MSKYLRTFLKPAAICSTTANGQQCKHHFSLDEQLKNHLFSVQCSVLRSAHLLKPTATCSSRWTAQETVALVSLHEHLTN